MESGRDAGEDYSAIVKGIFDDRRSDADVAEYVVRRGWAGRERLEEALRAREVLGKPLAQVLLKLGILDLDRFTELLSAPADEDEPRLGGTLGRYVLRRVIGRGGMATVFEADDPVLQRRVALKVIPEGDVDEEAVRRLHREAAVMAQLRHPNIVGVHETGVVDVGALRFHYLAMDYIPGKTMAEVVADREVDRETKLRMLEETARAVAHAHGHGILHRDLKPSNVLVNAEGQVLLTDFGLARAEKFRTRLTGSREILGTPAYMAPEQIAGRTRAIDERSDVYALGVMLYEILTGRIPFEASSADEIYFKIVGTEPERPSRVRRGVERDLDVICLKAIEKDPKRRYAGAAEFAEDLRRFRAGEPILAKPPSVSYRVRKWMQRQRKILILAAAVIVSTSVVWIAVAGAMRRKADRAEAERKRKESARESALAEIEKSRMSLEQARTCLSRKELDREKFVRCAEEAAEFARSAERIAPDLPAGRFYLAQAEEMVGDWELAEADYRRAIALDPGFAPARALLGRLLMERAFEIGYALKPDSSGIKNRVREIHEEASVHLRAALESGRGWESALQRATVEYDLAVAERRDNNASALMEENAVGFGRSEWEHLQAFAALSHRDPRRRIASLDSALRLQPHFYLALIGRGEALVQTGQIDRALEDLNRAVVLCPQRGVAYLIRSFAHDQKGDQAATMEDLSEAIRLGAGRAGAYYNRGLFRSRQGDREGAMQDYTRAIELDGAYVDSYNNRGAIYVDLGRFDEALRDFEKVIALDPLDPKGYYNRGWVFRMQGETGKAIASYTQAIRVHPGDAGSYLERAFLYEKTGDRRGAAEDAREALKRELPAARREAMTDLLKRLGEAP